jgi:hypothetical protein
MLCPQKLVVSNYTHLKVQSHQLVHDDHYSVQFLTATHVLPPRFAVGSDETSGMGRV